MKKLFQTEMSYKIRSFFLTCFILLSVFNGFSQSATTVLPNNASYSGTNGPQGSLRYQRIFYLVKPAEMNVSGITSGMNINSIGFTLSRAQQDTTKGQVKIYLQNTTDVVSRADTGWNTVTSTSNLYHAIGLFPGSYEWQVKANCTSNSAFSSSVAFSNDDLDGCNNPYNLKASGITTTAATLTWEAATSASFVRYRLEYTPVDTINWIPVTTTDTFYNASGLKINKSYQWRVRTLCSADSSAINSSSFTTKYTSNCNPPSGLSASVTNDSLVALRWTGASGAFYYEIQLRRIGTESWSNSTSFADSANIILPAGTTYEWQVRTVCDSGTSRGNYISGSNFATGGTAICYEPTNPITRQITDLSADLTWTAVPGATSYSIRYRLKNTISWTNAITPMTNVSDTLFSIPDTTGAYEIPFVHGSAFTYNGGGVYVALEYSRPNGALTSPNLTLSTTRGTSIAGVSGQDSVKYLLCMVSRGDAGLTALPNTLGETRERPETRFGSTSLKDSIAVVAVYALGKTAPRFQSPTPISAKIANLSTTTKSYNVTLTVKEQVTGTVKYTVTQPVSVTATDTALVTFNGWSPNIAETDSITVSIPAETNENVTNNNQRTYFQQVNGNVIAYDDGTALVSQAGFDTSAGLILTRYTMKGCGKVLAASIYLTESAAGHPVKAVIRNATGTIVAQSPLYTATTDVVNGYHSFYFTVQPSFSTEDFYIGLSQSASATPYNPVGTQWEDGEVRSGAYYKANSDGTGLVDYRQQGRLMIRAELVSSAAEVSIKGNLTLCTGATNTLSAGSTQTRYANSVVSYSSQNGTDLYSASQALGSPNVYPVYALSANSWITSTADGQRESLALGFADAAPINFVDIYETANGGAVDSVFVKNPGTNVYELVYSGTAAATTPAARKNHISFTQTAYNVSEILIKLNSPAVSGYNAIDAVGIGRAVDSAAFASYLWSPGGETSSAISVSTAGVYTLKVTDSSGCQSVDSVTVKATLTAPPVISGNKPAAICAGDSIVLTSNIATGILWSNGATTESITVSAAGSFTVSYNDGAGCGSLTSSPFVVTTNALPAPVISGSTNICIGNRNILNAGSGFTSYLWSTGEATQSISVGDAGVYDVKVTNANGCSKTVAVTTVYITLAAPSITGNLSFCPGGNTVLDAGAGYASYSWSNGAASRTITVSTAADFMVVVTNIEGCSASASVSTSIFSSPVPQINGNAGFCAGSSTTLSATAGYASYLWSTTATTASITVNSIGTKSVTVTDNNGCTGSASRAVVLYPNPTPVIAGTLSFCGGTTTTLNAGAGYSSYLWSTAATTQTINVSAAGSVSVTVVNNNGCTASATATISATGILPATPGAITGPAVSSCNTTSNVYSIAAVPNTTFYVWSVPAGATIVSGQGTTSVSVNYGPTFQGGNIVVAASNGCGQSGSINPRQLFVRALANVPGTITGQTTGVCGPSTKPYSIVAVPGATSYTWSVPAGSSIVSGQGTSAISVSFTTGFSTGNICVTANNGCGSSAPSCTGLSGVPPVPGPINGPTLVCSGQTNLSYNIVAVTGATSYTWTSPQSSSISLGQGSREVAVNMGPNPGNITVKANSACGSSAARTIAIAFTTCFAGSGSPSSPSTFSLPELRPVPEVISAYGGFSKAGTLNVEWTLGEPRVASTISGNTLYTEGFHQPLIYGRTVHSVTLEDLKITVYPNPFKAVIKVSIETEKKNLVFIELKDTYGRTLLRKDMEAGNRQIEMNTARFIGGVYYLVVSDASGIRTTVKLININ